MRELFAVPEGAEDDSGCQTARTNTAFSKAIESERRRMPLS
jgi:hypothetical protein